MSPYAYCANNPIKFIDPDGRSPFDIIHLNEDGSINRVEYDGSANITIIDYDGTKSNPSGWDISSGIIYWNNRNRQVIANIAAYYAKQDGITGVGASNDYIKGVAYYDTTNGMIWIGPQANGHISEGFNNKYNLRYALKHEDYHKQNDKNNIRENFYTHALVELNAEKSWVFKKSTRDKQDGGVGYFSQLIMNSAYQEDAKKAKKLIDTYNKSNTGYQLDFDQNNKTMYITRPDKSKRKVEYEKSNRSPNLN